MKEYLYNIKMALKRHGFIKSICLIFTLTGLHAKKILVKGSSPKKERLHGFFIHFFDYATLTGLYEEIFIQDQYHFMAKNSAPIIIDCGSNIGMSVLYFKKLYPEARVIAFEPDPDTFAMLKQTAKDNGFKDVKIINSAVAGKNGRQKFYSDKNKPGNLHMSLLKSRVKNGKPYETRVEKLSSYIKAGADFVKMDVEGAEAEVISELDKSGKLKKIGQMAIEVHHNIEGGGDMLNAVTGMLVKNKIKYMVSAAPAMPFRGAEYQDILLFAANKIQAVK
jgi:FkbM family methyltransferase